MTDRKYTLANGAVVKDGLWIAEGPGQAIGTSSAHALRRYQTSSGTVSVSAVPFGLIVERGTRLQLVSARQVVDGDLGPYPYIRKLRIAREAQEGRRHRPASWVQMYDLAVKANRSYREILLGHWRFLPLHRGDQEPKLDTQWGPHSRIHDQLPNAPIRLDRFSVHDMVMNGESWSSVWVRQEFAETVLRLATLGYRASRSELGRRLAA